jgi:hypothetical protein
MGSLPFFSKDLDSANQRSCKVKQGIEYILEHISIGQPKLFPRIIQTRKRGVDKIVYNRDEIFQLFDKSNFIDCWINANPEIVGASPNKDKWAPNILFMDIDNYGSSYSDNERELLFILERIHVLLGRDCNPTILWTGHGYHIYIVLGDAFPLGQVRKFRLLTHEPTNRFLKFAAAILSNKRSDPRAFSHCWLRVPYTLNSDCLQEGKDPEVKIIQSWDRTKNYYPTINHLLDLFYEYLLKEKKRKNTSNKGAGYFIKYSNFHNTVYGKNPMMSVPKDKFYRGRYPFLGPKPSVFNFRAMI